MLGLRPEEGEATREWWFDRVHPDDLPLLQGAIEALTQGRASDLDVEYRIRHRTGTWVWIWQRGLLLRDPAGRPNRLFGALLAVTERKETEAALRESELLKGAILTSALDCIVTIDQDSRIVEWNPASERTFGHARQDVLGRDLAEVIIPPELRESHHRGVARSSATAKGRSSANASRSWGFARTARGSRSSSRSAPFRFQAGSTSPPICAT
jgi:PAS domain S-box-containing protein